MGWVGIDFSSAAKDGRCICAMSVRRIKIGTYSNHKPNRKNERLKIQRNYTRHEPKSAQPS